MKILFKNTTRYDKENRDNFINFHQNKYGIKELFSRGILSIVGLYLLIFNMIHFNWKFFILLIPICIFIFFINKYAEEKEKEKNKKQKNKEFTFFFYERHIKIKYKRQFERMLYFEIKKIYETEKNFFLYTDDKHSLILDKDGFSIGTSKGFSDFIRRKCPFKYSNKDNK